MKCVLCGSNKSKVLIKTGGGSVVECKECKLVRTEESRRADYKSYHRDEDYHKFEKMFRNIFLSRLRVIERFIKKPGRALDIGASTGVFLELFKKKGWETWGVEPSRSGKIAEQKGIKILGETFEKATLSKNYFDLVILNHTLEHVLDPVLVLKKVNTILKNGGIVFVDVPNFGGLSAKIFGKYWRFLTPNEHLFHFTEKSLKKVMQAADFKVLHQESRSGLFEFANPLSELWDALTSLKKRFFTDLIILPYSIFTTVLNMGNSMTMIAKKT